MRQADREKRLRLPDLTQHQHDFLQYLVNHRLRTGYVPNYLEMAKHWSIWPNAARDTVKQLTKKGYISFKVPGEVRSMWFPQSPLSEGQF